MPPEYHGDIGLSNSLHEDLLDLSLLKGSKRTISGDLTTTTTSTSSNHPRPMSAASNGQNTSALRTKGSIRKVGRFPSEDMQLDAGTVKRLERWIKCFCLVEFDLDQGPVSQRNLLEPHDIRLSFLCFSLLQDLDSTYPLMAWPPSLQSNIAFSSLPEGDLPTAGAHSYSWRIPIPVLELPAGGRRASISSDLYVKATGANGDGFLYGFVYFVQEKVRSFSQAVHQEKGRQPSITQGDLLRRGYSQRSLVLVRHRCFLQIFDCNPTEIVFVDIGTPITRWTLLHDTWSFRSTLLQTRWRRLHHTSCL